jgi:hypothetical protein
LGRRDAHARNKRTASLGVEIYSREQQTPEALGALQKAQIEIFGQVIRELGIRAE